MVCIGAAIIGSMSVLVWGVRTLVASSNRLDEGVRISGRLSIILFCGVAHARWLRVSLSPFSLTALQWMASLCCVKLLELLVPTLLTIG